MLYLLIAILGIFLTIFFVVGIHELGHFLVARLVGVKVARFSIGFGKPFYRWYDKKGTEYVLAPIPLGGYIKMVDENEETVPKEDLPFAYNRQPFYKKFAIAIAGPLFNALFALIIYWGLFVVGFVTILPLIGNVTPHSIAAEAGLQPNQEIIQINNHPTHSWESIVIQLLFHAGDNGSLQITTQKLNSTQLQTHQLDLSTWQLDRLKPDPLESLGIKPYEPTILPVIGTILPESPAASILKKGDEILAIDNKPIKSWMDVSKEIDKKPDTSISLKIKRDKKILTLQVKTSYQRDFMLHKHGFIGLAPAFEWPKYLLRHNKYSFLLAIQPAWETIKEFTLLNFIMIGKMITGKVSLASLGGPITIFESAGAALNNGIVPFFGFLAFLSIAIGFINVLPIPGLDGGHVLFQVIELIIRRPIPIRVQVLFYHLGLIFIFLLIMQALANDIQRL